MPEAMKYIIVESGTLADGRGTKSYQIFELTTLENVPVYRAMQDHPNDPISFTAAVYRWSQLLELTDLEGRSPEDRTPTTHLEHLNDEYPE